MAKKLRIIVTAGKLLKDGTMKVSYSRFDNKGKIADVEESHPHVAHKDLKEAFSNLTVHACSINEFIKGKDGSFPPVFQATGFITKENGDDLSVILTANRSLNTGKVFNFNTPLTRIQGDDIDYGQADDLVEAINKCRSEIIEYLNGKYEPDPQMSLDLPELPPPVEEEKKSRRRIEK